MEAGDRFCKGCGAPLGAAASGHELRKTVTAVFCDLVGSTALGERLDPEAFRHVLGRYYAEMRAVLERHGGLVEKFVGDAVVAVFGVPVVHEDDALRAVRAAAEMRSALESLGEVRVAVRIGVNTGEVVAGDLGPGASFASGDAVNVAARLEEAAVEGEILLGTLTRELLGDAVEVEELPPLLVHGKGEPLEAFRLVSVGADAEAIVRHFETPFVDREHELAVLGEAFEEALAEPACRLVTVVGEPGIGKTRLLREFADSAAGRARVLRGGCLAYGEGITYWPLREIAHELCGGDDLAGGLASCLAGEEQAERIGGLILSAIGASEQEGSVEEVQWAVRRLLETLAAERPLVVVLEDLHWAEPTLLQLVEYVAGCSTGAPLLLLGAAREELLDTNPGWALPHPHSRLLPLEPLPKAEAGRLVDALTTRTPARVTTRERLLGAGGGNPLFLEQLVAHEAEDGEQDGELVLPATITALLATRLDRLSAAERDVLERAAVEGTVFHRGTVTALLPDHEAADVGGLLLDAVRRNLIRPCQTLFPGDEGYQFAHILVRDAVYESMPKELRAQLHERFAARLEQTLGSGSGEVGEILGYHLEQAARYLDELGRPDDELALAAGERLSAAGRTALGRGDVRAAESLLERALSLTRPLRLDVQRELDLANCLLRPSEASALAHSTAERAAAAGDAAGEAYALAFAAALDLLGEKLPPDRLEARIRVALPLLEQRGDDVGLATLWRLYGHYVAGFRGHWAEAADAAERAILYARRAGRPWSPDGLAVALVTGPVPAGQALARLDELVPDPTPFIRSVRAWLMSMLDRIDEAQTLAKEAFDRLAEQWGTHAAPAWVAAEIAALAGDLEAAALHWREHCDWLEECEAYGNLSVYAPCYGRVLCALGRHDEAEALARRGRELGDEQDVVAQVLWRQVQGLVEASRGEHDDAERLAREAVAIVAATDSLGLQGDAFCDLAEVLDAAGRPGEAAAAYREALDRYERKENLAMAAQVRSRLEAGRLASAAKG